MTGFRKADGMEMLAGMLDDKGTHGEGRSRGILLFHDFPALGRGHAMYFLAFAMISPWRISETWTTFFFLSIRNAIYSVLHG